MSRRVVTIYQSSTQKTGIFMTYIHVLCCRRTEDRQPRLAWRSPADEPVGMGSSARLGDVQPAADVG
jgi:hypothetical protein